ncbi:MAG TPA: GTP cyclohydrolase I FolE [Anaerolineaceae bacterium]|jgi:GTP cyclohydrolase I|nr:GTP cyclohydrolase I FolE [Anaerolineaceae bacterium]NMD27833.1 GTP cyclohydrolase I FolE [Chloroflexota bacterium]HOA21029.1 GTP cyclohydrolase I FolE [Anaerolineaceae bacterium]HOG76800.1 GTP cyclohydrolase I FolE [Anaerolineaceae bacterium]
MDCEKPLFRAADLFCETDLDYDKIQRATTKILEAIGEKPDREGLLKTPSRVAKAYGEILAGYRMNPEELVNNALFTVEYDEMVIVKGIEYYSMCEHHMLPFYGIVHVAYIPSGKVIGLSKIPRIVEMFTRRLQVQERMTIQIADFLQETLQPKGVAVVAEGKHLCMMMRGVKKQDASMTTSHMLGAFRDQLSTRMEFLNRISAEFKL